MWGRFPGVGVSFSGVGAFPRCLGVSQGCDAFPRCGGEFLRCGSVSQGFLPNPPLR